MVFHVFTSFWQKWQNVEGGLSKVRAARTLELAMRTNDGACVLLSALASGSCSTEHYEVRVRASANLGSSWSRSEALRNGEAVEERSK